MEEKTGKQNGGMQKDSPKYVEIEYNGLGPWTIDYPKRGRRVLGPGMTERFNVHDRFELHALLQIIKQINNPKSNTRTYIEKKDMVSPYKTQERFRIKGGMEHLPEILRKLSFGMNSMPTQEEEDAIRALAPNYFDSADRKR